MDQLFTPSARFRAEKPRTLLNYEDVSLETILNNAGHSVLVKEQNIKNPNELGGSLEKIPYSTIKCFRDQALVSALYEPSPLDGVIHERHFNQNARHVRSN